MEKAIILEHDSEKMVLWETPHVFLKKDFEEDELRKVLKLSRNSLISNWRKKRFEEYKKLGFPVWKRVDFKDFVLPEYSVTEDLGTIEDLDKKGYQILEDIDFEGPDRKLVLLSDVFFNKGFYISVENERKEYFVEIPENDVVIENNVVSISEGFLKLIRLFKSENSSFRNSVTRVLAEENSKVVLITLNFLSPSSTNIESLFVDVKNNVDLEIYDLNFCGKRSISHVFVRFLGDDSKVKIFSYSLQRNKNVSDLFYGMRFYGKNNEGLISGKSAVKDEGKVVMRGVLDIRKGAKDTVAREQADFLLLSKRAMGDAIPSIFVDENEVTASHGVTFGKIDEESIYYMMTRGFTEEEARKFLIFGFFNDLLEKIHMEENLGDELKSSLQRFSNT